MEKQQSTPDGLALALEVHMEARKTEEFASDLRIGIEAVAQKYDDLPTAGILANLLALVDVWENQQVTQLDAQYDAI